MLVGALSPLPLRLASSATIWMRGVRWVRWVRWVRGVRGVRWVRVVPGVQRE